ncbi:DUF2188 domain-containing protein [Marinilabiliaceae bacterium ANBcel2]|nr:DUF2188 domain-containing protein [Marinilabiliaceae bacterium ANBcel2]
MGKNQHVVPVNGKWGIRGGGNVKLTKITNTQKEAIEMGRAISKNQDSELLIHNKEGQIRQKNSYGNDPRNIKG